MQGILNLNKLILSVSLGWTEEERKQLQDVSLSLAIQFKQLPLACTTDELGETYCYDQLSQKLQQHIASKSYKLLEHLAYDIFNVVRECIDSRHHILITVTKKPPMDNLYEASFTIST